MAHRYPAVCTAHQNERPAHVTSSDDDNDDEPIDVVI